MDCARLEVFIENQIKHSATYINDC